MSPARSQTWKEISSPFTTTDFLSILTPIVERYFSEKIPRTQRATRLVLPTPGAPIRASFLRLGIRASACFLDGERESRDSPIRRDAQAGRLQVLLLHPWLLERASHRSGPAATELAVLCKRAQLVGRTQHFKLPVPAGIPCQAIHLAQSCLNGMQPPGCLAGEP